MHFHCTADELLARVDHTGPGGSRKLTEIMMDLALEVEEHEQRRPTPRHAFDHDSDA